MSTYTFTSSLLTALNRYSKFNALNTPFYDSDAAALGPSPFTHGYAVGGQQAPTYYSTVDKFTFSTDTAAALPTGASQVRSQNATMSSSTDAYAMGGNRGPGNPNTWNQIEKFAFSTDARASVSTTLSVAIIAGNAAARPSLHGYVSLWASPNQKSVDKFVFSGETRSTLATLLTNDTVGGDTMGSNTAAYIHSSGDISSATTTVDKVLWSTDVKSTLPTGLATSVSRGCGMSSTNNGYYTQGGSFPPAVYPKTTSKFSFADDSRSTIPNVPLSGIRGGGLASSSAGYTAKGSDANQTYNDVVQKLTFSTDTWASLGSKWSNTRGYHNQCTSNVQNT